MGIGGLLALDSEPAHWCLYPLARVARGRRGPRWIFLRDAPAALAACRAKGPSPTAGRSRCVVMVASALNLHLKGRRLTWVFASYTRARRRRRCSFLRIRLAANAAAARNYGVIADRWPAPRQADGYRRSARSGFRAGTLVSLSVGACGAWAPRAALD